MGVSEQDATQIAKRRVVDDAVMSIADCGEEVRDEGAVWHVSFPISDPEVLGGSPNVRVDKQSGTIVEVYYTQ